MVGSSLLFLKFLLNEAIGKVFLEIYGNFCVFFVVVKIEVVVKFSNEITCSKVIKFILLEILYFQKLTQKNNHRNW